MSPGTRVSRLTRGTLRIWRKFAMGERKKEKKKKRRSEIAFEAQNAVKCKVIRTTRIYISSACDRQTRNVKSHNLLQKREKRRWIILLDWLHIGVFTSLTDYLIHRHRKVHPCDRPFCRSENKLGFAIL